MRDAGWILGLGGLVVVGLMSPPGPIARVVAQDGHGRGHGGAAASEPAALFSTQCASCHVTPDPTVATDRAYIRQLQETA